MILLFLVIFQVQSGLECDFAPDYKKLLEDADCEEECYFDQPEITLKTMEKWPSECMEVCGIITLNQNCDVSVEKLRKMFRELMILNGGVRIENTSFTGLSFIPQIESFCSIIGISIVNNSELLNVGFFDEMFQWDECVFRVADNPKLDASGLCDSDYFEEFTKLEVFGNKVDCGCRAVTVFEKFIECERIEGNLVITDITDPLTPLKVRKIIGDLVVKKTNLTSLSFLENLEEVKSKSGDSKRLIIDIHDNYQMTSLGLKALRKLTNLESGHFMINIQRLHTNFCLTVDEMQVFVDYDGQFANLEAIYCKDQGHHPVLCVFERMSSLESDCEHILGDILIESGDEDYVDKLKTVTHVFGTITVQNTDLDNGKFLKNLRRVASLNSSLPPIQILSNKRLKQLTLPSLLSIVSRDNRVVFDGNGPDIFDKTSDCMRIQRIGQTNVTYNGAACNIVGNSSIDEDYKEYTPLDWLDEYEGGEFYDIKFAKYQGFYDALDAVNDVTAVIGFIVNIFHLIVLFQKELRNNFIYIMMIGISVCDTLLVSTFILDYALEHEWLYRKSYCGFRPYFHVVLQILGPLTQSMTRRCSSLLAFSMALFRTCSVMFPMSGTVVRFSRPNVAVSLVIGLFALCILWDFSLLIDCQILLAPEDMCEYSDYTAYLPDCPAFVSPNAIANLSDVHVLWYKVFRLIDGFSTVIIGLLYLIVTIGLLVQIQSAQKRRKSLKSEKSDSTSLLVTLMALTFFLSGLVFGSLFIIDEFFLKYYPILQIMKDYTKVFIWTLLIINSTVHCLICFGMSAQYRDAAKGIFRR